MPFTAAPHHDVLVLLVQIAVLLFTARALGELAQRMGQPSVVGEIFAGILLGPSLLSGAFPALGHWIVPETEVAGHLLETVSLIGAMFLLLITGLETDLRLIKRHARTALGVSFGGITVTFASGFLLGQWLPDSLLANPDERLVFALFVATAMSISAIPVIAKVLMDLNLMRRDVGQTIIASGMSDDTIGWILLSIVAGLATGGAVTTESVLRSVGGVAAFLLVSFTAGRWLVKRALDFVQDEVRSADRLVTLVVAFTFAWGAITQALGLEAVLGAFVMGILFGQMRRLPESVHHALITMSLAVFTPIFFAVAGLKVNARSLLEPDLFVAALIVIFVATAGKVVGTYLGARLIGRRDHWTSLSFGAGLNARGAMEIIIATIGLQLGILSPDMFSIIVVMAMATSLMAPPALRWVLARVQPEAEEMERLAREDRAAGSVVAKIHRVLLPVRRREAGDDIHTIAAHLLERMGQRESLSLTLFNVAEPEGRARSTEFLDRITPLFGQGEVTRKIVEGGNPEDAILDEAQKDYDLVILGGTEKSTEHGALFHPMVDRLVRMAPVPTLVIKGPRDGAAWPPRRILVPTNGSVAARHAAEIAFMLAAGQDAEVIILNVMQRSESPWELPRPERMANEREIAEQIVEELRLLGEGEGARTQGKVIEGGGAEHVILRFAREAGVDLVVLGTDVRPGSDRLFLGPRVESILEGVQCPALVVNAS